MWATFLIRAKEVGGKILTSKIFIYAVIILASILALKGFFKKDKFEEKKLPDSGSGLPRGWGVQEAKLLAAEADDVISGLTTLNGTKEKFASKLMALSNDQITLVYNAYNKSFGENNKETLTEAMNNEWNYIFDGDWTKVIARLRLLKLY
jgi:hypothetical protein